MQGGCQSTGRGTSLAEEGAEVEWFDREGQPMLWTIFVILLVLWLLGMVSSYTMGGFIHLLLIVAVVVVLIQLLSGRRVV